MVTQDGPIRIRLGLGRCPGRPGRAGSAGLDNGPENREAVRPMSADPHELPQPRPGEGGERTVLAIVLAGAAVRLVLGALVPITVDEAYYVDWARHLQPGYLDHPPLVAWLLAPSLALLGSSTLAVRRPAVLLQAGTTMLAASLARARGGRAGAVTLALLLQAVPIFSLGATLMTPDAPLAFAWAGALFAREPVAVGRGRSRGARRLAHALLERGERLALDPLPGLARRAGPRALARAARRIARGPGRLRLSGRARPRRRRGVARAPPPRGSRHRGARPLRAAGGGVLHRAGGAHPRRAPALGGARLALGVRPPRGRRLVPGLPPPRGAGLGRGDAAPPVRARGRVRAERAPPRPDRRRVPRRAAHLAEPHRRAPRVERGRPGGERRSGPTFYDPAPLASGAPHLLVTVEGLDPPRAELEVRLGPLSPAGGFDAKDGARVIRRYRFWWLAAPPRRG